MRGFDRRVRLPCYPTLLLVLCCLPSAWCHATEPPVTALAFAPNEALLVAGSQSGLALYRWPGLEPAGHLETSLAHVHALSFSPDGSVLAVAGGSPSETGTVELWSWSDRTRAREIAVHTDTVYDVAWSPDGRRLASAGRDRLVCVLDAAEGRMLHQLEGHSRGVLAVTFLGEQSLASAGEDASIRVWNLETQEVTRSLDNHTMPVHALAVRPAEDGAGLMMLASASDDETVRLWQPSIGRLVRFLRLESVPLCLAWTPDGTHMVTGCADGHVRAIDADTLEIGLDERAIDGWCYALAISTEGQEAAAGGSDGQIRRITLPKTVSP